MEIFLACSAAEVTVPSGVTVHPTIFGTVVVVEVEVVEVDVRAVFAVATLAGPSARTAPQLAMSTRSARWRTREVLTLRTPSFKQRPVPFDPQSPEGIS